MIFILEICKMFYLFMFIILTASLHKNLLIFCRLYLKVTTQFTQCQVKDELLGLVDEFQK